MVGLCRLCAAVRKKDMLIPMNLDICQKVRECFGIEMCNSGDKLPKCACGICLETLQNTFSFFQKVKESQESLALLLSSSKDEKSETVNEVCVRLNESELTNSQITAQYIESVKDNKIKEVDIETDNVLTLDSMELNMQMIHRCIEEDGDDEYQSLEILNVMDVNSSLTDMDDRVGGESLSQLSENSTDVKIETYFLEDVDDDLEEGSEVNEETDTKSRDLNENNLKPTIIEILPANNCVINCSKSFETTEANNVQVNEWKLYTWICHSCSKICETFAALRLHAKENHEVHETNYLQFKCADCQKLCVHYNKFLNHVRFRHYPELSLRCDACDIQQESYQQLAAHRENCAAAQQYPLVDLCNICGKSFHSRNATLVHSRAQHNEEHSDKTNWHQCTQCEKKFKRVANLRAHEHIHSGLKEFACDICDRKFRQKHNLEVHLYTHINERVFECKICNKSLKTSNSLEKHQLIHKDIKKFACDYCDKEFRTKDAKLSHERIHTGEKPFKCKYCDRCFRFRSGLMGHINLHTGNRPYSCQDCSRQFTNWGNMNKHLKRCSKRQSSGKST
ncbi:zinc finger protein 485-like [Bactrocera neohumeralis]|uniref:zinc finger protein 485-like n=1 Tax=Bactrocera neohumeralis TaxID=98809 RepID=UPI0021651AA4|nr:zinc finger protein 485-like [Bactrocera neohumeralis]